MRSVWEADPSGYRRPFDRAGKGQPTTRAAPPSGLVPGTHDPASKRCVVRDDRVIASSAIVEESAPAGPEPDIWSRHAKGRRRTRLASDSPDFGLCSISARSWLSDKPSVRAN
jgi:hypothetical protein